MGIFTKSGSQLLGNERLRSLTIVLMYYKMSKMFQDAFSFSVLQFKSTNGQNEQPST